MALFGEKRDISMFRHVNRELMANIISQQAAFYKYKSNQTNANIYGEASEEKFYDGPILLYCLVDIPESQNPVDDFGVNFSWKPIFQFLRDDLLQKFYDYNANYDFGDIYGANYLPQPGDIILYYNSYYEVDRVWETQYFLGKNPDFPNDTQPPGFNPGLGDFGYNVAIACDTHYIPADKVSITLERM